MIPYTKHCIDEDDIQAVVRCLRSEKITQGPLVEEFERKIQEVTGSLYAVVFNSGTSALEAAYYAVSDDLNFQKVFVPAITFVATANAVVSQGARVYLTDIDPDTYCMDIGDIEFKADEGDIIVPVHLGGKLCDMEAIRKIAYRRGCRVVEDACHAFGYIYNSKSDAVVYSFHPAKHITTGEGGAVTTNDRRVLKRLLRFRDNGRDDRRMTVSIGHNYRMSDISCALGMSQIKKLSEWSTRRQLIALRYNNELKGVVKTPNLINHALHLYIIRVPNRDTVKELLYQRGIGTQIHYQPIYRHPYYSCYSRFVNATEYAKECLSLPLYPTMTDEEVGFVIKNVREVVQRCR